jgi:aryl-alcohol dehydrogenase-like predicted oxidoreductase
MAGGDNLDPRAPGIEENAVATIRHALDRGLNWIDTSNAYGLGMSERLIAKALAGTEHKPFVFTKCGWIWDESGKLGQSLRADSVRRGIFESLDRLELDSVDVCMIHWPVPDEDIEEGWGALVELKAEGVVRHIGASNFSVGQMERCERVAPVELLQPPFSLADDRAADDVLPYCAERDIGVIVYSPQGSGLLSGSMTRERFASLGEDDVRRRLPPFQEPALTRNLEIVDRLRKIGETVGASPGELAIAWTLSHPAVTAAIVGFGRPEHVDDLIGADAPELARALAAAGFAHQAERVSSDATSEIM